MTRVDEAVISIKQMIHDKCYDENGFLPSEGELSEKLGVSRITVREAVRTLEVRGFVTRLHGKGVKVADNSNTVMIQVMTDMFEKRDLTVEDVLEVRTMIEPKAAELAATRASEKDLSELLLLVEKMDKAKEIDEKYIASDYEFHKKIVSCTKNNMMVSIVNAYSEWLKIAIYNTNKTKENLEHNYNYHRNIYKAIKTGDAKKARKTMIEHLNAAYKMYISTKDNK